MFTEDSQRSVRSRCPPGQVPIIRAVVTAIGLLALPIGALVHQQLLSSYPGQGEQVSGLIDTLRLAFAESVELAVTRVQLVRDEGGTIDLSPLKLEVDSANVVLVGLLRPLTPGSYTMHWRTAGSDGHAMADSILFSVVGEGGTSPIDPQSPQLADWDFDALAPAYIAIRWALFVGLLGVVGAVCFRFFILPRVGWGKGPGSAISRSTMEQSAASVGVAMAILVVLVALLRLYAQSYSLFGPNAALAQGSLSALFDTRWGRVWWIQLAAAATALAGFLFARRRIEGWILASIGVLILAYTPALSGHALSAQGPISLGVLVDGVHVLAAGGWLGSLLVVLVVGIPAVMRVEVPARGLGVAALIQAFSPVAVAFAGGVVVTGILSAWLRLGAFPFLWTTEYGRTLLIKVGVISVLFVIGGYNHLKVRPTLDDDAATLQLRRSVALELLMAAIVILVTAVLVATPLPRVT